jgi:TDG/mug DNA glycosylase family protein
MKEVRDIIAHDLIILFVGYNPGARSAEIGHHFAGYSNRFWKLLYEAGLTPRQVKPEEDDSILKLGYGITNIVARPSRTAAEITKEEYNQGRDILKQKLAEFKPRIACYEGIGVYKEFAGRVDVACGLQPSNVIEGVLDFVVSSPSGLNRIPFSEQLTHYIKLKELALHFSHDL